MKYTKTIKVLSMLLVVAMLAVMLPAFTMTATESEYEEAPESLTASAGNLAIGATPISQYTPNSDSTWKWDINLINDGTMNTVTDQNQIANGGYHPATSNTVGSTAIGNTPHSEWVGYDFGEAKTFNTVTVYPCRDSDGICHGMPNTLDIDISADGENWVNVYHAGDIVAAGLKGYTFTFASVTARYVRVNGYVSGKDVNNCYYMKLCEIAVFNSDITDMMICPNLALDAKLETSVYHNDSPTWYQSYINDGNRYNLSLTTHNYGQYTGWHTQVGAYGNDGYITYDFEEAKKFDKVVIVPATARYDYTTYGSDDLKLPSKITVQVSDDNATWKDVATLETMPTSYQLIELTFTAETARYCRIYMTASGQPVKLSEIEVYDSTNMVAIGGEQDDTVITKPNTNMALEGTVVYSSVITSGTDWQPQYLNDGITEGTGFTTAVSSSAWVGYEFEHLTTVNKVVLYPSTISGGDIGVWSGIPKSFTVEYTTDGLNWVTVATVTNTTVPDAPVTVLFDAVNVKTIRISSSDLYPKQTDEGRTYIQLAEMEVWNTDASTELEAKGTLSAFIQTRPDAEVSTSHDLRMVLVANYEAIMNYESLSVTLTFELAEGGQKVLNRTLGGASSDYVLYKSITAGNEVYTAVEGNVIFGNIVTDIPNGAYTGISLSVVDQSGNTVYEGSTN